jgi:predicted PurR-regulated permease PerM
VAFLEFLLAAAWARIVASYVLQSVAHRLLMRVAAVRAVYMAVMMVMVMLVVMVAIGTVNVVVLVHRGDSTNKIGAHYPANGRRAVSPVFSGKHSIF